MKRIKGTVHSNIGFYIGDICYCLSNKVYHDFWGKKKGYEDGVYVEPESMLRFAVAGTAHGDGCYHDRAYNFYEVDAGVIGLVPLELVEDDSTSHGRVILAKGDAVFEAHDGVFRITLPYGEIVNIDTNDFVDDEDDDDDYEE